METVMIERLHDALQITQCLTRGNASTSAALYAGGRPHQHNVNAVQPNGGHHRVIFVHFLLHLISEIPYSIELTPSRDAGKPSA